MYLFMIYLLRIQTCDKMRPTDSIKPGVCTFRHKPKPTGFTLSTGKTVAGVSIKLRQETKSNREADRRDAPGHRLGSTGCRVQGVSAISDETMGFFDLVSTHPLYWAAARER
jgi:hypothetical protein